MDIESTYDVPTEPMSLDEIMGIARSAARIYGNKGVDLSYTVEDFSQIAALKLWQEQENRAEKREKNEGSEEEREFMGFSLAFTIAKNAIMAEYQKIYALKRKAQRYTKYYGAPGDINDPELTSFEVACSLSDERDGNWLNDVMIKDELQNILLNEVFEPREAQIIEYLLRGWSPVDIGEEFSIGTESIYKYLRNIIKRIRNRMKINIEGKGDCLPDLFSGYKYDFRRMEENGEKKLLKGGIESGGSLLINIDIDGYFKAKEEKDKKFKEDIKRKKKEALDKLKREGKTLPKLKKRPGAKPTAAQLKRHAYRGGAKANIAGYVAESHEGVTRCG